MDMELLDKSVEELERLAKEVQSALKRRVEQEFERTREEVRQFARERGYEIEDLFDLTKTETGKGKGRGKSSGPKSPLKYRNPDNPEQTWTGRGRKPQWILAAEEAGIDLTTYEIANQ